MFKLQNKDNLNISRHLKKKNSSLVFVKLVIPLPKWFACARSCPPQLLSKFLDLPWHMKCYLLITSLDWRRTDPARTDEMQLFFLLAFLQLLHQICLMSWKSDIFNPFASRILHVRGEQKKNSRQNCPSECGGPLKDGDTSQKSLFLIHVQGGKQSGVGALLHVSGITTN